MTEPKTWVDRVKEADQEAENAFEYLKYQGHTPEERRDLMLYCIVAELRAARIAQRPSVSST